LSQIKIVRGSLLDQKVDAIVNAANTSMRGGGGIDGVIHAAAGPGLLRELIEVAPKGASTGEVIVTHAHDLPFDYILHTAGPVWRDGKHGEDQLLANCYRNALRKAVELDVRRIGFCSISTGIYGFPVTRAAEIALREATEGAEGFDEVIFAMFGSEEFEAFRAAYAGMDGST
jgi:O-acetyl-ADP-ribose deacetylase (regulator of RNase III)